ncbi:MAG: tRNA uridine-5-carboxymethylaminomethyl(34) synthesis GTPase MnmE [Candidatus Omnitrophota bacterium]
MNMTNNDTIAAISTPPGAGGIGIVRLSGKDSLRIADRLFLSAGGKAPSSFRSHSLYYGCVRAPRNNEIVDEALVAAMRSPATYTKEDMVEINCHGGMMPLKKVLDLCLGEGARLAEPGEFTKRAFLNGRIDLSQAEAVLDIINAETDTSRAIAARQLRGEFSAKIKDARDSLLEALASIELAIDFSQQDVEFPSAREISRRVKDISGVIAAVLATAESGIILREGASVVICGRPNVGKSSLLNALLKHERVIVTPVAGTTRDVIEESINISGVKVRIADTAGIIETRDKVELEGIKRSREKLASADIALFVLDSSRPLTVQDEEIYGTIRDKNCIIAANKSDLPRGFDLERYSGVFSGKSVLEVSAKNREGLEKIEDAISDALFKGKGLPSGGEVVTNIRHKKCLESALEALKRAGDILNGDFNPELAASDLYEAAHSIGLILGESIADDVLDRIFSGFCIGK